MHDSCILTQLACSELCRYSPNDNCLDSSCVNVKKLPVLPFLTGITKPACHYLHVSFGKVWIIIFGTTQRVLPTGQFCIVSLRTLNYEAPLSLCVLPSLIRFKELTLVGVWRARTAAASDVHKRNLSTSNRRVSGDMSTKNKKKKIPDRWKDYQAMGKRIPGTRFIAFKVPLKESLMKGLPPSEVFGLFDLIHLVEEENEELGLIIDLTFTTRYYTPMDLPDSVNYLKIFTTGHQVPSDSTILSFKKAVNRFLQENEKNDKLIGVHCTHGLNRTGYLVCRYLIDVEGMVPSEAVALFNRSRGHCIERQNYLDDLLFGKKRSNIGMDNPCQDPIRGSAGCSKDVNPFCKSSPSNKQVPSQEATHCRSLNHRGMEDQTQCHSGSATHSRPLPHYVMRPSSPFRHEQNQGWPQFLVPHHTQLCCHATQVQSTTQLAMNTSHRVHKAFKRNHKLHPENPERKRQTSLNHETVFTSVTL